MKKTLTYILCAFTIVPLMAQDYTKQEILFRGAAGINTFLYDANGFANKNGFGGSAGLGYNFFFNTHLGIGTGLEFAFYSAKSSTGKLQATYEAFDKTTQEDFSFQYVANNFEEQQSATMLTIPLLLTFQSGNKYVFYGSAGLRISIPVSASFEQTATEMTTTGTYPSLGYPVTNIPEAGFTTVADYVNSGNIELKTSCLLSAEAGMKWSISENWKLYTGLYIDYGLNNIQKTSDKQVVEYQSATPNTFGANSILSSSLTSGIHTISYGVRIGLVFGKPIKASNK